MTEKQNIQREPLVRLAKRDDLSGAKKWAIRLVAIVLALVVGSLFIAVLGHNPIAVYHDIITGSLGGPSTAKVTVRVAIPLLGAALAIAPAFKMKFWNIGAEGQIMVGGIAATYFALYWYDKLPKPALLIVMAVASILAGGIWGLVPAFCKARWGTNETLFTLMLNYIAIGIEAYLQNGPWKDPSGTGFPIIAMFDQKARLPKVGGVHIGWIIVLALTVGMFIYMKYSKHGYEISVVGESQRTARYAGMNVGKIIMRTMFLSGAICGPHGLPGGLRRRLYAQQRHLRRRGLHGHHRSVAGPSQSLRHGAHRGAAGCADQRLQHHSDQLQDPCLGGGRALSHHPLLHAGL